MVDTRWDETRFWRAIHQSVTPITDRNLLAAVDLRRDETGAIEPVPPSTSANLLIMWRTFVIAGLVTVLCALIGLPYAMLAASITGWKRNILLLAVLLPLLAGSLLVFMVAIDYYITLALVGGPNDQMISSIIAFYALQTANWGMAGALGLILLVVTTIHYHVYGRLSRGGAPTGA